MNPKSIPTPLQFPPLPLAQGVPSNRPLRVCIASFDFVGPVKNGGVGTAFTSLGEALAAAGHEVTLLFLAGDWCENRTMAHWIEYYRAKNIHFVPMPPQVSMKIEAPFYLQKAYEAYLWLRGQSAFDVVHFSEWKGPGYFTMLAKHQGLAFENTTFCVHTHGPTLWHKLSNNEYVTQVEDLETDFVERQSAKLAGLVVSPSQYLLRWMRERDWQLADSVYVQQYVRPATARKPMADTGSERRPVNELVFFGRLEVRKGIVLFCDALDRLKDEAEFKHAQITFLGKVDKVDGRDAADYVRDRAKTWPWRPRFVSDKDQQGAMDYLQGGPRLALLPSLADNLPNTVLECLGARVPFLASNAGGIPEMVAAEDQAATCFPLRADAFAQKLRDALRHGVKPAREAVSSDDTEKAWTHWHASLAAPAALGLPTLSVSLPSAQPRVSICLSHWNRPHYLRQALASIEAQDYPNFEVVLIDDGSTQPEAKSLIDELEPKFKERGWPLLRNAENRYPGAARNRAVQQARGEYVMLMDDDNCAKPHELSTFVRVAQKTGADLVTCFLDIFSGPERPSDRTALKARWMFLGPATAAGALRNWFGDTNSLIRREVFLKVGGFHEDWGVGHEDWEFFARAVLQGYHLEVVPEPLAWYRLNEQEATVNRKTPVHANHMANIRPYLEAVPPALRHLILFAQGQLLNPSAGPAADTQPYVQHSARWRGLYEAARVMVGLKRPEEALRLLLDGLKAAEASDHPLVVLEALLSIGEAMGPLDLERARQILELAGQLAGHLRNVVGQEKSRLLLGKLAARKTSSAKASSAKSPARSVALPTATPSVAKVLSPRPVLGETSPLVSIIIPTLNNLALTRQCLAALAQHTAGAPHEIIVVDNGSTDGTVEFLKSEENAGRLRALLNGRNLGFARACNQGALEARTAKVLFLNNDTEPQSGWLAPLIDLADDPGVGAVGAKLLYPDGRVQHAGIGFINGVPDHPFRYADAAAPEVNQRRDLDMVTGACLLLSKALFLRLGGFDEVFKNGVEDVDLCLRVRSSGHRVVYEPASVVIHHEGKTPGRFNHVKENLQLFFQRWEKQFDDQKCLRISDQPREARAERSLLTVPVEVGWDGSFLDLGSLSHVNRELTGALERLSPVRVTCLGRNSLPPALSHVPALRAAASRLKNQSARAVQVTVRHAWPPNWKAPQSGAWVLIQPWEYGAVPEEWVAHSRRVDEIWVPSQCARRMYIESGVEAGKVQVVPNGIDPKVFHPEIPPVSLPTQKTFKFLFVGGTIKRKGPDVLLEAFCDQFTAAEDVCLVIKDFGGQDVYAGQTFADQIKAAQARPNAPEILYLTEDLPDIAGLYTACDCLVHPYRGEGFGLPVLEAMACGLPVIVTGGGATDDFALPEFAYHIPSERQAIGNSISGMKLAGQGWWLEPVAVTLIAQMQHVFTHREEAKAKGRAASEYARREWTWDLAAEKAAQRLRIVAARQSATIGAPKPAIPPKPIPLELPPVARVGQLNEARDLLNKRKLLPAWNATLAAIHKRPFHPEAYLLLAEIARSALDFGLARQCGETARRMAPSWKPARKFLKSVPGKAGKPKLQLPLPPDLNRELNQACRLTVCLITKNEEKLLGQCLESIRPIADQIIVMDTGSEDWTVNIAERFDAEVYACEWQDDFSAARNAALERARGDWVLCLDADEELRAQDQAVLQNEIRQAKVMAYRLPIVDIGREEEGHSYVPRLFRNAPGLFFVGRVHEQVFSSVEVRREQWGLENRFASATLLHHGYTEEMTLKRNKVERNLRLLERALEEMPGEPSLLMNYGLELARSGRLPEGVQQYQAAFDAALALPADQVTPELREALLTQLSTHLLAVKDYARIVEVLESSLAQAGGLTASLHFALGLALMETQRYDAAAGHMRQCLAKRNQSVYSPINKEILKAGPHHCLALCLSQMRQTDAADQAFREALQADPQSVPAHCDYALFLHGREQSVEALKLLNGAIEATAADSRIWIVGGQISLSQPGWLEFARDWTGEAMKLHGEQTLILAQRAEALMLSQDAAGALPLWRKLQSTVDRRGQAALIVCEQLAGVETSPVPKDVEPAVSQEFLGWYRKLVNAGAAEVLTQLNRRLAEINRVLPTAAGILEQALLEANQQMAV